MDLEVIIELPEGVLVVGADVEEDEKKISSNNYKCLFLIWCLQLTEEWLFLCDLRMQNEFDDSFVI